MIPVHTNVTCGTVKFVMVSCTSASTIPLEALPLPRKKKRKKRKAKKPVSMYCRVVEP